jgi:hypothetical protein
MISSFHDECILLKKKKIVTHLWEGVKTNNNLRSMFFTLCLFLEGLLMTLILLEAKAPRWIPLPRLILTMTSTRFRFSSASLICKCFETQCPIIFSSFESSVCHSMTPFCEVFSPVICTLILGGSGLVDKHVVALVVFQEAPESKVEGGGHKNLSSVNKVILFYTK